MRALVALALLATPAVAKPLADDTTDFVAGHLELGVLADRVELGTVQFSDAACENAFGKPRVVDTALDRDQLAACLWRDGGADVYRLGDRIVMVDKLGQAMDISLHRGRIARIGPAATTQADRDAITFDRGVDPQFQPSERVRAAIDRSSAGTAEAIYKLCHTADGTIASRRILAHSGNDAYDGEADAYARKWSPPTSSPAAACDLVFVRYPNLPFTRDANPDAITRPAVAQSELMSHMLAGDKHVEPDDVTKTEIMRSGKDVVVATIQLCTDTDGSISTMQLVKSSGFPAYEQKIMREMRTWRFKPFDGGACAPITYIYRQF